MHIIRVTLGIISVCPIGQKMNKRQEMHLSASPLVNGAQGVIITTLTINSTGYQVASNRLLGYDNESIVMARKLR